ncbi:MAG: DUF4159 domain-containing protein [Acidobacteria bacterium]|nr:DUF4159 domain-containing protein [Acidobacteriota bacterium]
MTGASRATPGTCVGLLAIGCLLVTVAVEVLAQDEGPFFGRRRRPAPSYDNERVVYDGRFAFVRLRYGGSDGGFWREPPWAHDYPRAERHFMRILEELTFLRPHREASNILTLDDPELSNYPIAYMSEPGFWSMNEDETTALRNYLHKGGFLIFDDFRGAHWQNFEARMREVLPEGRLVELDATHPIFHSFFEIDSLDFVQFYERNDRPLFYGMYEDNDPQKRLLLVANYNNDIGEYWEFSDTGYVPIDLSNEAYKLGVNYVMYAMTH